MASDRDDLLRVDGTGTVHPVGRVASQLLRSRAGEWRLIPSPKDLIIARSMLGGDAVLKLAGEIRTPGALSDIVSLAAQSQWRGELILLAEVGTRSFYFDHGVVLSASTTVPDERLGETLYRFGVITREQLEKIVTVSAGAVTTSGSVNRSKKKAFGWRTGRRPGTRSAAWRSRKPSKTASPSKP